MSEATGFLVYILPWSVVLLWLAALVRTLVFLRRRPRLEIDPKSEGESETFVSILVPARNEASRVLDRSIPSMINQTCRNFELIVLNDRSTDETLKILEKIKARRDSDPAFHIIDGAELPEGWLGKPRALEQARQMAGGDWILTTDADIIFAPKALHTAVRRAESEDLDALTLSPKQILVSFWEKLFMPVFGWFNLLTMPLHRVNDPNRKESMGVGNFFMFRRTLLENLGGFAIVRDEVAEDLKLAALIKAKGYKLRIFDAPGLIETRMYQGLSGIWEGFSKNFFPGMNYSIGKTFAGAISIFLFGAMPFFSAVAALVFGQLALFLPFLLVYILQVMTFLLYRIALRENPLYAFLTPLGLFLFAAILINSAVRIISGKGVRWKDREIYQRGGIRRPPAG
ncbi:MAG: glycosyltransferase family 2 protein [Pyrinomonadaceae bacterium]